MRRAFPEALILASTEMSICGEAMTVRGDHAAREETFFGLSLFPEQVDLAALMPSRDETAWPGVTPPHADSRQPRVEFEAADPLFAQMGEDALKVTAKRGEKGVAQVVDSLARTIDEFRKRDAR